MGGGITGAAVARDAARRGIRAALVEARDFAQGTSSRSSRLVHGGLRYLENFEFDLVFEASRERQTLLRIAPHLVRPLEFFFPIYRDGRIGRRRLDAGMWLYDALSLFRNIERHQMLSPEEVLAREPRLRPDGLLGGARYFDAQVDDARLVVSTVVAAAEAGAAVANRVEAGRIRGANDRPGHSVTVRDAEGGGEWRVDALAVVLAAGPWTDRTLGEAGLDGRGLVQPSRGTHVHVHRKRLAHERALIFESAVDGRIMFVLPWRDLTLIGTTDDFDDRPPEEIAPTAADVSYLLESTNQLFPESRLAPEDVVSAWAGLRPLAAARAGSAGSSRGASSDAVRLSRDFVIEEDPPGVFTVVGGKLTSHRSMAEETVDRVRAFLAPSSAGRPARRMRRRTDTHRVPLPGGDFDDKEALRLEVRGRAAGLSVSPEGADRLARAYGTRAHEVLDLVEERPDLASPLVPGRSSIAAEAVHAVRREMALHAEDVAYRRTRVGLEVGEGFETAVRRIVAVLASEFGWDAARGQEERERLWAVRARDERYRQELGLLDGAEKVRGGGERR